MTNIQDSKAEAMAMLAAATKRCVQIDDRLHVFVGSPEEIEAKTAEINALIQKALNAGKTVTEKGVSRWIVKNELVNTREFGSAQYKWRGDQVRCIKQLVTKQPDGSIRKKQIGYGWKNLD